MIFALSIAKYLGRPLRLHLPFRGENVQIKGVKSAHKSEPGYMVFAKEYSEELIKMFNEAGVFVIAALEYEGKLTCPHVISPAPRLDFARAVKRFFVVEKPGGIAGTAVVSPFAQLGEGISVGHFAVIGDRAVIGEGTEIREHVVIGEGVKIGRNCLIKANTVIGGEGFGFEFDEAGIPVRIPHLGRVIIGDNVEIGSLNAIARGTLDDTVIGDNVKTDDHVFIAHNVEVGDNTLIIAGAEVSGGVKIGRNVWIAPQATIRNQVEIGDGAMVGMGAVVTKSVKAGAVVIGNPAREKSNAG